jgi:alpha-mannosidase
MNEDVLKKNTSIVETRNSFSAEKSSNLLKVLYEEPNLMNAWTIGNVFKMHNLFKVENISVVENGPLFTILKITRSYKQSSFEQYITIYENFDRIDFRLIIDWKEVGNYEKGIPTLKVAFSSDLDLAKHYGDTPYGFVERTNQNQEVPSNKYIALSDGKRSLALFNDCKHGFSVSGNIINMTLIRSSFSPDLTPDSGISEVNYSIKPYYGEMDIAKVTKDADSYNRGFIAQVGETKEFFGNSGLIITHKNIVPTCIKPSHDGEGVLVRMVELHGKRTKAGIKLEGQISRVYETDIQENIKRAIPIKDGWINVDILPYENRTLNFHLV